MSAQLGPPLIHLFVARPPLKYAQPADVAPEKRNTKKISGISQYLEYIGQHDQDYTPTESIAEAKERKKAEKERRHELALKEAIKQYDPNEDEQVKGDPYKTLFISRLSYAVTESDLEQEFTRYGPIEHIRLVRSTTDQKPKGYAFLVFEREKDMRAAYKDADGIRIKDRRIVVDIERGRTVKDWKPMRLGGGIGGRHYTKQHRRQDRNDRAPTRNYDRAPTVRSKDEYRSRDRPDRDRPDRDRPDRDRPDRDRPDRDRPDRDRPDRERYDKLYDRSRPISDSRPRQRYPSPPPQRPDPRSRAGIGFSDPKPYNDPSPTSLDPRARQVQSYAPSAPWLTDDRDPKRRRY